MKKININIIVIIISLFLSFIIINYLKEKSNKIIIPMAEIKIKKIVSSIINNSINDIEFSNDLYSIDKDNNEIKMINYNSKKIMNLLSKITSNIEDDIYFLESTSSNELNPSIPLGIIFNNTFLNNIGPNIKLNFKYIGSVITKVETEVKPYGINNAYIEIRVHVSVTGKIVLPFSTKDIVIDNVIPVYLSVIEGKVPEAYISSIK